MWSAFLGVATGLLSLLPTQTAGDSPAVEPTWSEWYALGPFDHPAGPVGVARPYPPEKELARLKAGSPGPDLRKTYLGRGKAPLAWFKLPGPTLRHVDFQQVFPPPPAAKGWHDNAAAYLYCNVLSPAGARLSFYAGSDDSLRLWWNGELVVEADLPRGLDPRGHRFDLELVAGVNHLLVKVCNGGGPWAFQLGPAPRRDARLAADSAAVERAIAGGVEHLLATQHLDGSWGHEIRGYGAGSTAFAAYALLKSGLSAEHPALQRALAFMAEHPPEKTYSLGCFLMAVAAAGRREHLPWLEDLTALLLSWQHRSGLFPYPDGSKDLSNTLFAALGLREAGRAGVVVPERAWQALAEATLSCQGRARRVTLPGGRPGEAAGFMYYPDGSRAETGSMTTAGLTILAIARDQLDDKVSSDLRAQMRKAEELGMNWLVLHFSTSEDPGGDPRWKNFNLYGLERVGSLLDLELLAGRDWYAEGAARLLEEQGQQGSWLAGGGEELPNTCLALLFLRRATTVAVTKAGEPESAAPAGAASPEQRPVRLYARGGAVMTLWVEYDEGLALERVEYFAAHADAPDRPELLASKTASGPLARFAVQHAFERAGAWTLWCRAYPAGGSREALESLPLTIRVDDVVEDWMLRYARDGARNLIPDGAPQAEASSAQGGHGAGEALDGLQATSWRCTPDDRSPRLRLQLRRPAEADVVLLSHAGNRPLDRAAVQAARVRMVVNGKQVYELEMPEESRKGEIRFDKAVSVRSLEVTILELRRGVLGNAAVGFAEIELLKQR